MIESAIIVAAHRSKMDVICLLQCGPLTRKVDRDVNSVTYTALDNEQSSVSKPCLHRPILYLKSLEKNGNTLLKLEYRKE